MAERKGMSLGVENTPGLVRPLTPRHRVDSSGSVAVYPPHAPRGCPLLLHGDGGFTGSNNKRLKLPPGFRRPSRRDTLFRGVNVSQSVPLHQETQGWARMFLPHLLTLESEPFRWLGQSRREWQLFRRGVKKWHSPLSLFMALLRSSNSRNVA